MATITGTDASDFLVGTADADLVNGGLGNDTIRGLGGNDTLNGAEGNDDIDGGDGNDHLIGGAGDDTIQGGMNSDTIEGGAGNDVLRGGKGFDSIDGGDGNDTIYSGLGQDTLTGGAGADVFVVRGDDPNFPGALKAPTITDFVAGTDTIAIQGATADEITTALTAQTTVDGGVQFSINGATIVVKGTGLTSLTASNVTTEDGIPENNPGQTFTLTTNVDSVTGTDGNDTISAVFDNVTAANSTYGAADVINGSDGTDRLNILANDVAAADDDLPAATVSNVEQIYVRNVDAANELDVNTSFFSGATQFWNDRSTSAVEFENVAAGSTIGVNGNGQTAVAATKAGYVAAATAGSLAIANGVTGGNAITVTGTGLTSFAISSTGAANTVGAIQMTASTSVKTLTVDAATNLTTGAISGFTTTEATTITVTGAGRANLNTLAATVDTVDASGNSGGLITTLGAGTTAVTGSSGNDRIDVQALNVTKTIDGGAGTDTVVFTNSTNYAATAAKLTNFEVLRAGTAGTYDISKISGLTAIEAQGGTLVFNNLGATTPVTAIDSSTKLTFALADATGASDALNLTIDDDATTAAAITLAEVNTTGIETLNVTSGDALASGTPHVITALTGTGLKTVNVSGTSDLTISNATGMAALEKIDATDFTKNLIVGGAAQSGISAGDTVIGGSGADNLFINFASLGTTTAFTGGSGDDTLTVIGNGSDIIDGDFASVKGVDNLVITSATSTTVTLGGFAQAAIATVDANSDGRMDITATALTTTSTINASSLTSTGVDVVATLTNADSGGAQTLTVNGGAIADTITVTADDTADADNDDNLLVSINGGNGIDVIKYTATATDVADVATFVTDATSLANADIITGFVGGNAGTVFDYNGTLSNAVTDVATGATLADALAVALVDGVYVQTNDIANSGTNTQGDAFTALLSSTATTLADNYAALEAQLLATGGTLNGTIAGLDADITNGQSALIVLDNGTGSIVLRITNDTTTANTITASEIDLVAVFTDATGLVAADFI